MYNRELETKPAAMDAHNKAQKANSARRMSDIAAKKKAAKALKKAK